MDKSTVQVLLIICLFTKIVCCLCQ